MIILKMSLKKGFKLYSLVSRKESFAKPSKNDFAAYFKTENMFL